MELTSVFNTRKSIRSFTGEAVSEETMKKSFTLQTLLPLVRQNTKPCI